MWQDILTSFLTSGVITGIFVLILNKAIENKFEMKLEAYKDKLKSESDKELMQLTKDLELKASERSIKLAEVITIQVKALAELHQKLLEYKKAGDILVHSTDDPDDVKSKKGRIYMDSYFKLRDCHDRNRIFIPDTASKLFDDTMGAIWKSQGIFGAIDTHMRLGTPNKLINDLEKQYYELQKQLPNLLKSLENEFKRIIGVNHESRCPPPCQ
jgi:hypothetical protein